MTFAFSWRGRLRAVFAVAIGFMAGALYMLATFYYAPGPLPEQRQMVLPKGSSTRQIAHQLAAEGIVDSEPLFYVYAAWGYLRGQRMKAGEYRFPTHASPREVFLMLWEGLIVIRQLTIPEGYTVFEIKKRLMEAEGLEGEFPRDVREGDLLPETYRYSWGDARGEIVTRMRAAMRATLTELWPKRQPGLPFDTERQALTLASIVEKETALADERGRVAAVYINRLRKGMKLQADPTVIYGLTGGNSLLDRPLALSDLKIDSPYNTYFAYGLPPSPIANPGRASIAAVLNPPTTDEIYFVADGTGGHRFAATAQEHARNVALYRQWEARQKR